MNAPDRVVQKANPFASALVSAQKQFAPALKTSSNPAFKSKYAALDACVEAVIDALNSNGFFLTQRPSVNAEFVSVETILIHESGEERSFGTFSIPVSKHDAHGTMSATTYCRRGGLMAAMGIAPEDDDGNAAAAAPPKKAAINQAMLQEYRAAAMKGMADLQAHHKSVPACGEKTALWASEGEALKSAANLADKETADA